MGSKVGRGRVTLFLSKIYEQDNFGIKYLGQRSAVTLLLLLQ